MQNSKGIIVRLLPLIFCILVWPMQSSAFLYRATALEVGYSSGSYDESPYSEIHGGASWHLLSNLVWRNKAFFRFYETQTIFGADTSFRFLFDFPIDRGLAIATYVGPGYRLARSDHMGPFIEAGAMLKTEGVGVGFGFQNIFYSSPKQHSNGTEASASDQIFYFIIAIGGAP